MTHFDCILVLEYFRSATAYLCLIKYLSSRFRIGLYLVPTEKSLIKKNGFAHQRFVRKCVELGAVLVGEEEVVDCQILIVQQRPYPDSVAAHIMKQIRARKRVGLLALALAGIGIHDRFLEQFQIDEVYVVNRRLFDYLLKHRKAENTYAQIEAIQIGLPYADYPLFPEFKVDYLIATPTGFSFHSERDKHTYLRNILSLLDQLDSGAVIAYKPHNAQERDYFRPRVYSMLGVFLDRIPCVEKLLEKLRVFCDGTTVKKNVEVIITSMLFSRMKRRVIQMDFLTENSELALEVFLPGVKQGVIGGLSNTIWGTLFFGCNFYNCVDDSVQNRNEPNKLLGKSSANLLDLNLGFFYVPCCHGRLENFPEVQEIITEEDRRGDVIVLLRNELQTCFANTVGFMSGQC